MSDDPLQDWRRAQQEFGEALLHVFEPPLQWLLDRLLQLITFVTRTRHRDAA